MLYLNKVLTYGATGSDFQGGWVHVGVGVGDGGPVNDLMELA